MDRAWMYKSDRRGQEFFHGVDAFFRAAAAYRKPKKKSDDHYICCPCVDCKNEKQFSGIEQIRAHLLRRGFKPDYIRWTAHGEHEEDVHEEQSTVEEDRCNDMTADEDINMSAFEDTFVGNDDDDLHEMLRNAEGDFTSDRQHEKFERMKEDIKTPVFPGCKEEHNKLHVVLTLLQMKSSNGWSDKGFNELLQFLRDLFPRGNELPKNTYHAKQLSARWCWK
jgi:hypothetical protein